MFEHNIVCVIPARKNSRGLKNKNIQKINQKELILFPFELAQNSKYIKHIIFSSDSEKYIDILKKKIKDIKKNFYFVKRPKKLAEHNSKSFDVISHALKNTSIQAITHLVLLEPTSPLTSLKDLDRAIEILFKKKEFNSVVSLISNLKFSNTYNIKVNANGNCVFKKNVQNNRQNVNQSFYLSGNFYISKIKTLLSKKTFYTKKTFGYKIKEEYYTDIDNHLDLMIARLKYNKLYKKNEL